MRLKRLPVLVGLVAVSLPLASAVPAVASGSPLPQARGAAVPGSSCMRSYDPYAAAKSFLAQCGDGVYPAERTEPLPGGGTAYVYDVDGLTTVRHVPPAGFDPLTAPAARLAEYGYPARPSGGQALAEWTAAMSLAHPAPASPYLVTDKALERLRDIRPDASEPVNGTADNPIWAGYMAISHTYTNVYSGWIEPTIHSTNCPAPLGESTWVGLGGFNTATLAQDGTAVGEDMSGVGDHEAWYELIDNATNIFVPIPIYATPGKGFLAELDRISGGYNVFVESLATGDDAGYTVSFTPYDGSTAEMVEEDPYGGSEFGEDLLNFKNFKAGDAEASDNNSASYAGLAHWPNDKLVMKSQGDNATMAYPGGTSNSGRDWTDYFSRCY